jgi:hypothetical protein
MLWRKLLAWRRNSRPFKALKRLLHMLGERSIGFKSLAEAWADTTTPHGPLLVTMLAGIAEFERELIKARTGEDRKRAQARGVRFGLGAGFVTGTATTGCLRSTGCFCGRQATGRLRPYRRPGRIILFLRLVARVSQLPAEPPPCRAPHRSIFGAAIRLRLVL